MYFRERRSGTLSKLSAPKWRETSNIQQHQTTNNINQHTPVIVIQPIAMNLSTLKISIVDRRQYSCGDKS
jgi:hypothetical protein